MILASFPSPPRGVWELGPIPLRAYALFIIVGIIVALWWGERRWVDRGGRPGTVADVAIYAVPFGLIGGRLYHVLTDWKTYFGEGGHPVDALKVWEGGLGIWGAIALGAVGAWVGCRRLGVPIRPFADALAPAVVLAQAIGRIGNYFNQELYGGETTVPWALEIYTRVPDTLSGTVPEGAQPIALVHPTFLYELLWNVGVAAVVVWADRRWRMGHGRVFALYVAGYCLGRFGIELMRTDHASEIFGVRVNVFTAAIVFSAAVAYLLLVRGGREDPAVVAGTAGGGDSADSADSADSDAPSAGQAKS